MDIKEKVEEIMGKLTSDKELMGKFKDNPVKVIEETFGVDLPDEAVKGLIDGIKAKMGMDALSGVLGMFKKHE